MVEGFEAFEALLVVEAVDEGEDADPFAVGVLRKASASVKLVNDLTTRSQYAV